MAKIETFSDDCDDLSQWSAMPSPYDTYFTGFTADGEMHIDIHSPSGFNLMWQNSGYDILDSWWSFEITSFDMDYDAPTTTVMAVYNEGLTAAFAASSIYMNTDPSFSYAANKIKIAGTSAAFDGDITDGPVILGWRIEADGTYASFVSQDAGSTWLQLDDGLGSYTIDDSVLYRIVFQGNEDPTHYVGPNSTLNLDNFNLYEPPAIAAVVGPIEIAVPAAGVGATVIPPMMPIRVPHANATVSRATPVVVIINGVFVNMESVHADATITVPVTGTGPHLGINVDLTSAHADATVTGKPYTGITYGAPEFLIGPGIISAKANAPTLHLDEGTIFIYLPPANTQADCGDGIQVITGSFVIGDHWYYPITVRDSGTMTFTGATYAGDAVGDTPPGTSSYGTGNAGVWLYYQADAPEDVTFTYSSPGGGSSFLFRAFTGDNVTDGWDPIAQMGVIANDEELAGPYTSGNTITFQVNTGLTRIWVAWPSSVGSPYLTGTLTWSYVPSAGGLLMDINNPILDRTPDNLNVSVLGGTANEYFKFIWSPPASTLIPSGTPRPITLATIKSDSEGNLLTGTIPLPPAFHGNYLLEVIGQQSGKIAISSFTILNDPLPQDSESDDVDPVEQPGTKWFWDDARGHTWEMVDSPTSATRVVFPKNMTAERTTSGQGQHVIWQGIVPTVDWSFSGTVLSQAEYEQFEYFLALNRKFYITNHKGKTYIATLKSFEPKPHRNQSNFWTFDYTVTAIVYGTKGGD